MKNTVAAIAFMIMPSLAFAGGGNNYAVITSVQPVYKDNYVNIYHTECYDVRVPVYGRTTGGSNGDVFAGAIIGGAIGNQFGSGSGKDAMTVLGAIIGANEGSKATREVIVGYRFEQQCTNVARMVNEPVISGYMIEYKFDGKVYEQSTSRRYHVGQRVNVQPILE